MIKNLLFFIGSFTFFAMVLMTIAEVSYADTPEKSVNVWTSQTQVEQYNIDMYPSLKKSNISTKRKKLIVMACTQKVKEQSQTSTSVFGYKKQIIGDCEGVVGESSCIKENLRSATEACIASHLF